MIEVLFEVALRASPTCALLVGHLMHVGEGVWHFKVSLIVDSRPVIGLIFVV